MLENRKTDKEITMTSKDKRETTERMAAGRRGMRRRKERRKRKEKGVRKQRGEERGRERKVK